MRTTFYNLKNTIAFLIVLIAVGYAQAQNPVIEWQQCIGGSSVEYAKCIRQTTDGGYIIASYVQSNNGDVSGNHGLVDMWVVKLDAGGAIAWKRCLGGTYNDEVYAIEQTQDGGYILVGRTLSIEGDVAGSQSGFIVPNAWVAKLDALGALLWQKTLGGSREDAATGVKQTSDGGFAVVGYTRSIDGDVIGNHGSNDFWFVKLDGSGTIEWQKCFGGTGDDMAKSIQLTADGGYVMSGSSNSSNGDVSDWRGGYDFWVVKLTATADIQWQKMTGGGLYDGAFTVKQTSDGGYVIVGETSSADGDVTGNHSSEVNNFDAWVVKLNESGVLEWQKCLGGSTVDRAFDVLQTSDNGYIVAGNTISNDGDILGNHGSSDGWIVKLNNAGVLLWQKCFGGTNEESFLSIQQTSDGGCILTGGAASNNGDVIGFEGGLGNWSDVWVVKLAAEGLATFAFDKLDITVFPNPVGNVLHISAPDQVVVTEVKIFDIKGNQVLEQTRNCKDIAVGNLAQGIYILETKSNGKTTQTKFIKD